MSFDNRPNRRSSLTMDLGSDLGDNKAAGGGFVGAVPPSLATQMAYATAGMRARKAAQRDEDDQSRMSKLMLARMNTLEEGFRDVIQEVRSMRREGAGGKGKGPARMRGHRETKPTERYTDAGADRENDTAEELAFEMDAGEHQKGSSV